MSEDLLHKSVLTKSQLQLLQSMCNSRLGNYAGIPGLTSSLLGGPEHGKVRLFDCSREHQESLVPHSHRFDVMCLVLRGIVENHIWQKGPGDLFTVSKIRYLGAPGCTERVASGEPAAYRRHSTRYEHGEFYSMRACEVHSVNFSRDALVLFFEGPQVSTESVLLEPYVDGKTVPTFQLQFWMYQRAEAREVAAP